VALLAELKLAGTVGAQNVDVKRVAELEKQLKDREELLIPLYHAVAVQFADLHDTPARMKEKNVINGVVSWRSARTRLYWRLRRRLLEERVKRCVRVSQAHLNDAQIDAMLYRWYNARSDNPDPELASTFDNDEKVVDWLQQQLDDGDSTTIKRELKDMQREAMINQITNTVRDRPDLAEDVVAEIAQTLSQQQIGQIIQILSNMNTK